MRRGPFRSADQVAHAVRISQSKWLGQLAKGCRCAAVCQVGGKIATRRGAPWLTIRPGGDAMVCGNRFDHVVRFERRKSTRRRYLIGLRWLGNGLLDLLQKRFAAQQPSFPGVLQRIGGRVAQTGLDESSISPSGIRPSLLARPGMPERLVGNPVVSGLFTSVAGIAAPGPIAWMSYERTFSSHRIQLPCISEPCIETATKPHPASHKRRAVNRDAPTVASSYVMLRRVSLG